MGTENLAEVGRFMGDVCDPEIGEVIAEPVNYLSSTSVTELISLLSKYIERKLLDEIRNEKFTLLADESTDTRNRTQFSLFARWIRKDGPVEQYLGLINVEKTTSLALMKATETFFRGKNLQIRNVRFVGLDGCNTMSGEQKGNSVRHRYNS